MKTMIRAMLTGIALGLATLTQAPAQEPANAPPELQVLKLEEGVWDADITFPPAKPDDPPGKAKGVQVNTLKSDGRWMQNEFQVDGTPYQGTGLWGWDPIQGKYIGIWVDNNDHRIRHDTGTFDPATATMTWTAEMVQADGSVAPLRFTEQFKGDTRIFDMVAIGPKSGKEFPLLTIVFTRRPG